jgi:hypothetical protein
MNVQLQKEVYTRFFYTEPKMPKFIDHAGVRYGRLVVTSRAGTTANKKVLWECLCDCGNIARVNAGSLMTGNTTSCGCYLKERITKHGGWKKASYNTWRAMIRRCTKPHDKDYKRYGAMGISVCPEWLGYLAFAADMGEPEGTETLDRIDPYGNYNKSNCRWSSPTVQARNIRVPKTSASGVVGVYPIYGAMWMAAVTSKGHKYYSKVCNTIEKAAAARKELELRYW